MTPYDSVCMECRHYWHLAARTDAPAEDCYPEEDDCAWESENLLTEDGCYHYEKR